MAERTARILTEHSTAQAAPVKSPVKTMRSLGVQVHAQDDTSEDELDGGHGALLLTVDDIGGGLLDTVCPGFQFNPPTTKVTYLSCPCCRKLHPMLDLPPMISNSTRTGSNLCPGCRRGMVLSALQAMVHNDYTNIAERWGLLQEDLQGLLDDPGEPGSFVPLAVTKEQTIAEIKELPVPGKVQKLTKDPALTQFVCDGPRASGGASGAG